MAATAAWRRHPRAPPSRSCASPPRPLTHCPARSAPAHALSCCAPLSSTSAGASVEAGSGGGARGVAAGALATGAASDSSSPLGGAGLAPPAAGAGTAAGAAGAVGGGGGAKKRGRATRRRKSAPEIGLELKCALGGSAAVSQPFLDVDRVPPCGRGGEGEAGWGGDACSGADRPVWSAVPPSDVTVVACHRWWWWWWWCLLWQRPEPRQLQEAVSQPSRARAHAQDQQQHTGVWGGGQLCNAGGVRGTSF
jgi:hypothetical protein